MPAVSFTGKDSLILNDLPVTTGGDGDVVTITYPNNYTERKTGKDGNTVFAFNATGNNVDCVVRVLKGGADDKRLQSSIDSYLLDPAAFVMLTGSFTKRIGDGSGQATREKFVLQGGVISKGVDSKENVEGDTEQGFSVYNIAFASGIRTLI